MYEREGLGYAIQMSIERSQTPPKIRKRISIDIDMDVDAQTAIDLTKEGRLSGLAERLERQTLLIYVKLPHKWGEATLILRGDRDNIVNLVPTI
jgi:hypothetical protein